MSQSKYLQELESESIYVFREVMAQFLKPAILYSVGKDSSVLLHLARKAFFPRAIPFPLIHIDTGYKFPEMYKFRDSFTQEIGAKLFVDSNTEAINNNIHPEKFGTKACCGLLKTEALLKSLRAREIDAAIGGARRDEEKSRAKERFFSFRDENGRWDPKNQRPEIWSLFNGKVKQGESIRVFPLSNWTELDIWQYIKEQSIPVVPLYFAQEREVAEKNGLLLLPNQVPDFDKKRIKKIKCRFRSLGCIPCTGLVPSEADTIEKIIDELSTVKLSERATRVIDYDQDSSMELKKREGYF